MLTNTQISGRATLFPWIFFLPVIFALASTPFVYMAGVESRKKAEEEFRRDVAEGRRMPSGEYIVRDAITGCQYIRVVSYVSDYYGHVGHTLVPRLGTDGQPMGCGTK